MYGNRQILYYFTRIVFLEVTKIILEDKNKNDKLSVKSINNCIKKRRKKKKKVLHLLVPLLGLEELGVLF